VWQFVVLVVALLAWMRFCFGTLGNRIDPVLSDRFFRWIPRWFFFDDLMQQRSLYWRTVRVVTMSLGLVFNGVIGPIAEELYFRRFLLPRLYRVGWWAPLLNTLLFSLPLVLSLAERHADIGPSPVGVRRLVQTEYLHRDGRLLCVEHCGHAAHYTISLSNKVWSSSAWRLPNYNAMRRTWPSRRDIGMDSGVGSSRTRMSNKELPTRFR